MRGPFKWTYEGEGERKKGVLEEGWFFIRVVFYIGFHCANICCCGFFLAARILGEGSLIPWLCFLKKKSGDQLVHTNSTLYTRISVQRLSKLR